MARRSPPIQIASIFVFAIALTGTARAQSDDFFASSPGSLSMSHKGLEGQNQCNSCHDGGKALPNRKCLGCHDHSNLASRIKKKQGFHASSKVQGRKCSDCHKEHRGRRFDLMGWSTVGKMKDFDHRLAGWKLAGKHKVTDCKDCHKRKNRQGLRTFLGDTKTCGRCHEKEQPHAFERKDMLDCERCHSESAWNPPLGRMRFDHNDKKDAAVARAGAHEEVPCAKCHPKARFNLPRDNPGHCGFCHESPHKRHLFGTVKTCSNCHSPQSRAFKSVRFDHKRNTGYELVAKHNKIKCYRCHTSKIGKSKPKPSCEKCHAGDNKHGKRFSAFGSPPACATCHPQSSWKDDASVFNHETGAKFELTGKHADTACRACHRGAKPSKFEKFDLAAGGCMGCHQHEKAHGGKFANAECLRCHTEPGEKQMRKESLQAFHGPNSKFPLVAAHAKVQCQKCHINDVYKKTPRECGVRCHEDSLHRNKLGAECGRCHEPGKWEAVRFDHAADSDWPLNGLHSTVPKCEDCHPGRHYKDTPRSCGAIACHAQDDVHEKKLGNKCEQCHNEAGKTTFEHNRQAAFAINGRHAALKCANCHKDIKFKPLPNNCFGCHPEPAVHRGMYGTTCETCHTTKSFVSLVKQHDVGDFSLGGAHDRVDCARCHGTPLKKLGGTGDLCITCHREDDVHANGLSPRCGQCHTQWSFAPARFDHLEVGCSLNGLHRTLPCADCHTNGNFGPVSPECIACHRDSALKVEAVPHEALFECGDCHNPNSWLPAGTFGRFGSQSICR